MQLFLQIYLHTIDIVLTDCKYNLSFSAFLRNLDTCSGSSRCTSIGQPPSLCKIPRSTYFTLIVLAYIHTVYQSINNIVQCIILLGKNVYVVFRPLVGFVGGFVNWIPLYPIFLQTNVWQHIYQHCRSVVVKSTLFAIVTPFFFVCIHFYGFQQLMQ